MESKIAEYFEVADQVRTIGADLKDLVAEHEATEKIEELNKEIKKYKEAREGDEGIEAIKTKIKTLKERMELLKEIILVEMKEAGETTARYQNKEIVITEKLKFQKVKNK